VLPFRVAEVDRRAFALGSEAHHGLAGRHAGRAEIAADRGVVERFDAEAEVIEVAALRAGRRTAGAAEHAVDRHQVDQRPTGTQLHQADRVLPAFHGAAENAGIERDHPVQVGDPQQPGGRSLER
jgi:hypothetical protein